MEGERIEMFNISAAMGPKFAEIAREMTEKIRKLGPSPLKVKNAGAQLEEEVRSLTADDTDKKTGRKGAVEST